MWRTEWRERGALAMSVLANIVRERQEWATRQKSAVRHSHTRVFSDYVGIVLVLVVPYAVYIFRDKILTMIKMLTQ